MTQNNIKLLNLVPRFLKFYRLALECDEDTRYRLWKENYGFAAVPPGEEGAELAKKLLHDSWDKYAEIIPFLETWKPDYNRFEAYLCKIKEILEYNKPIDFTLVFFVGSFEGGAFVAPQGENSIAICLPVESGVDDITVVHELVHIVHHKTSGFDLNWEKTIAQLVLTEGLATRLSKHLLPQYNDVKYIEHQEGWLKGCETISEQILQGIVPYLDSCTNESVWKFTLGTGTTGNTREAYFVGWKLIEKMLLNGMSFADIARIKEKEVTDIIMKYI